MGGVTIGVVLLYVSGGFGVAIILAIEDSLTDRTLIQHMLGAHQVLLASDGEEGLEVLRSNTKVDLILLDLHMPKMNGFDFLDRFREEGFQVPIIILSNSEEVEKEIQGLEKGAVDFIRKPLNFRSLEKRIAIQLELCLATEQIKQHNKLLEELVEKRTVEIRKTNEITINALVRLLELRNIETSNHSKRTKTMMELMCHQLQLDPVPGYQMTEKEIQELVSTAPLHDIGKVGIPDAILLKPGRLNPEELSIMREHVKKGVEALNYSLENEDEKISFIETARKLIASHHEWFDGSGYPEKQKGEKIPLGGRIMAVIDVYDALTNERVYKAAMSHEEALQVMQDEAAAHFDPVVFNAFLQIASTIQKRLSQA